MLILRARARQSQGGTTAFGDCGRGSARCGQGLVSTQAPALIGLDVPPRHVGPPARSVSGADWDSRCEPSPEGQVLYAADVRETPHQTVPQASAESLGRGPHKSLTETRRHRQGRDRRPSRDRSGVQTPQECGAGSTPAPLEHRAVPQLRLSPAWRTRCQACD